MASPADDFPPIEFPTLGFLGIDWIEAHAVVPDGFRRGKRLILSGWQAWNVLNHYRITPGAEGIGEWLAALAELDDEEAAELEKPPSPFYNRTSLTVRPQKTGKSPFLAAVICYEAMGPSLFDSWAEGGEVYRCADWGCPCGWEYVYEPGEPMGMHWPTPLIQITATSEEQTGNIFNALRPMIQLGPLNAVALKVGEEFIRLANDGRIDPVSSNARSRLGQRVTFVAQDETGIYTPSSGMISVAQTQSRGVAAMGGRVWQTTNAWDPSEDTTAQRTYEDKGTDVFIDFPQPPKGLSYGNKADRRKIHLAVYKGSPWVNVDDIEGEAVALAKRDPQQAERFYGNRLVYARGSWLPDGRWDGAKRPDRVVPDGAFICLGFDGSENNDWSAIRAETADGHIFTPTYRVGHEDRPTIWDPSTMPGGHIDRAEVAAAVHQIFERYNVGRFYCDPQDWRSEIGEWALAYGEKVVLEWPTNQISRMYAALSRFEVDLGSGRITHDADHTAALHVANARKKAQTAQRYTLIKPADHQKIDVAMSSVLAHEATQDAVADGWGKPKSRRVLVFA
jgi:hypothetical protein